MMADFHPVEAGSWNATIAALPGAHFLQTWEWGQVKSHFGWQPIPKIWRDERGEVVAAALVLQRVLPIRGLVARLRLIYVPKGPLLDWQDAALRQRVLADLAALARQRRAIFIKIDPDVRVGVGYPGQSGAQQDATGTQVVCDLAQLGWCFSDEQIQFRNTFLLDLRPDLKTLLAEMKQKTRYNISLAERKGVSVRLGILDDLKGLYRMYAETANRDGFVIRSENYYLDLWTTFIRAGLAEPLVAEVDNEPAAAVVIFRFAGCAWYMNGMSRPAHREKMPNHLLQWEALQRAKAAGADTYDFWGAPDVFEESDSLWGVYRFKEGFGGEVVRHIGAWDLPVNPMMYRLYAQILPRILDWMRRRGKDRTRRLVG
jgi:lipid II:glycine glycyltransferase (peptidoglycan interpeptide bridge formation enzyme)